MATCTVQERGRHERPGRPYVFGGTLEVVHTRDGGARPEHVLVYRRDDGRRVVEFRTGGPPRGGAGNGHAGGGAGPGGAGPGAGTGGWPASARGARLGGAAPGPRPGAVARQLGLEVGE